MLSGQANRIIIYQGNRQSGLASGNRPRFQPQNALAGVPVAAQKKLVIYTKQDCPLCDGLKEKVTGLMTRSQFMPSILSEYTLEVRIINDNEAWRAAYAMEVPVLTAEESGRQITLPRPPPRITADRLQQHIERALTSNTPS